MANRQSNLAQYDVRVIVVGPGSPKEAADLAANMKVSVPLLADPNRTAHSTFGLDRALLGAVQQSGTVLIDRTGEIRYILRATNPANALDEATLMKEISALVGNLRVQPAKVRGR